MDSTPKGNRLWDGGDLSLHCVRTWWYGTRYQYCAVVVVVGTSAGVSVEVNSQMAGQSQLYRTYTEVSSLRTSLPQQADITFAVFASIKRHSTNPKLYNHVISNFRTQRSSPLECFAVPNSSESQEGFGDGGMRSS